MNKFEEFDEQGFDGAEYAEKEAADVQNYKCPACGAQMEFSPEQQALICPHCKTVADIQFSSDVTERNFDELYNQHKKWDGDVKTVHCENCGAEETLSNKEISTRCPFCGSNTVLKSSELNSVKPDTVIPFKIEKETAVQKCLKWIKSRIFAPGRFKKTVNIDTVSGTYSPVWTFDSDTSTAYNGVLGKYVTRTRVVNGRTETYTETEWFSVSGTIDCLFDDLYVPASQTISTKTMDKLKPFDQKDYVKYDNDLLAGFAATNYTLEPLDAWKIAEQRMQNHIKQAIVSKYHADVVKSLNMNVRHRKRSFKYLMLPVYVMATNYKAKLYNLYANGVHGKVTGKVPVSPLRVFLAVLAGAAVVVGIALAILL